MMDEKEKLITESMMFYNICRIQDKYNGAKLPDENINELWKWVQKHDKRVNKKLESEVKRLQETLDSISFSM